ncbi:cytochrome P450 [Coniochaeta sp. 2T2.1]|nr:cytochrome P450 [Coniochaeta sp. 2T2.1]
MLYTTLRILLGAVALVAFICIFMLRIGSRPAGLPPGPSTIPILGNLHQIPARDSHLQFQKWAKEYGPVYSLIMGTKTFIVLSSDVAVKDLLDKRSGIYSSRPDSYIGAEIISGGLRVLLMQYGPTWRMIHRMVHNILNITAAKSYVPYQELENKQMLLGLLDDPNSFVNHVRRYTNSLTTQMIFGFRTIDIHDPKLEVLYNGFEHFCEATSTGAAAFIDFFPILRSLPDFLVPARKHAKKLHEKEKDLYVGHWLGVKNAINAGKAKPCFSVDLAKAQIKEDFSDSLAGYISGSLLEAGSDTTVATLVGFIQAMVLYPEAQKKAQEEIDRVVGPDRLPNMDDEMHLPFVRGCVKESLRWMPTNIIGVPHAVTKDDEYMGYKIPKGAAVINNVWSIHMDPARHPDPYKFDPSRYIDDHQTASEAAKNPDPSQRDHFVFGAGRRICQGMHIAERSLFLGMSRMLWAFDFAPAKDENGVELTPDQSKLKQGLFVMPEEFQALITPRSEARAQKIRQDWKDCQTLLDEEMQWKEVPRGMVFSSTAYDLEKEVSLEV